jgi:hypothetical protein
MIRSIVELSVRMLDAWMLFKFMNCDGSSDHDDSWPLVHGGAFPWKATLRQEVKKCQIDKESFTTSRTAGGCRV